MCEALREFFEPELREARESGIREGMERGMERGLKRMIGDALKKGSSAEMISSVMGIPLEKVQAVEKEAI